MRVAVTGGAGFIGSHVTDRLIGLGHHVLVVDDLSHGSLENLAHAATAEPGHLEFAAVDIRGWKLPSVLSSYRPDAVCHLAAQIDVRVSLDAPRLDADVNVLGTIDVIEAARAAGVAHIVFASSGGAIYGDAERLPADELSAIAPLSPYGAAKASAELYLGVASRTYGIRTTTLALANVYGPRQDPNGEAGVIAIWSKRLVTGGQGVIFGDGGAARDFVFVGDVAEAFVRAVESPGTCGRYNIGSGTALTVRSLYEVMARACGQPDEPIFGPAIAGEVRNSALDISAARRAFHWKPFMPLPDGIEATVRWVRSRSVGASA